MSSEDAPRLAIDLSKPAAEWVHGDLTVILTWMEHDFQPCLVLIPTHRRRDPAFITPCIIPLRNAHLWDEQIGNAAHCVQSSRFMAANLGLADHPVNLHRLFSLINGHLGDLIACPPRPTNLPQVKVAEMLVHNHATGVTEHLEKHEDV